MRHAYMILAHNQPELLQLLLSLLDYDENDIVIHLDRKSNLSPDQFGESVRRGRLYFAERLLCTWGGYSQVAAELNLMRMARNVGEHDYYHLLSGADLPLRPIQEINTFYSEHMGQLFVHFSNKQECIRQYGLRVRERQYFRNRCGRDKNLYTVLNKAGVCLQKVLGIRNKDIQEDTFYFGSNWWDITEDVVDMVLEQEVRIRNLYQYGSCCDEVFLQSMIWNSPLKERLYVPSLDNGNKGNMRWIDMERGANAGAYVIHEEDVEDVLSSGMMFARKFDIDKYPAAVHAVVKRVR